jgi:hypothetical protein
MVLRKYNIKRAPFYKKSALWKKYVKFDKKGPRLREGDVL